MRMYLACLISSDDVLTPRYLWETGRPKAERWREGESVDLEGFCCVHWGWVALSRRGIYIYAYVSWYTKIHKQQSIDVEVADAGTGVTIQEMEIQGGWESERGSPKYLQSTRHRPVLGAEGSG